MINFTGGNESEKIIHKLTESVKNGTLCTDIQDIASVTRVSSLLTPLAMIQIKAFCNQTVKFRTIYSGMNPTMRPTSSPFSKSPTSIKALSTLEVPTIDELTDDEVHDAMGALGGLVAFLILGCWACLRCLPCCMVIVAAKDQGHLYDILVIVDDSEELILKNIRHRDIAYFRNTKTRESQLIWDINDTDELFEKRFEVEFFDRYDLMGRGLDKHIDEEGYCNMDFEMAEDKIKWRENYAHHANLETGMIIRVSPSNPIPHSNPNSKAYPNSNSYPDPNSNFNPNLTGMIIRVNPFKHAKKEEKDDSSDDSGSESTAQRFKGNNLLISKDLFKRRGSADLREMGESGKILSPRQRPSNFLRTPWSRWSIGRRPDSLTHSLSLSLSLSLSFPFSHTHTLFLSWSIGRRPEKRRNSLTINRLGDNLSLKTGTKPILRDNKTASNNSSRGTNVNKIRSGSIDAEDIDAKNIDASRFVTLTVTLTITLTLTLTLTFTLALTLTLPTTLRAEMINSEASSTSQQDDVDEKKGDEPLERSGLGLGVAYFKSYMHISLTLALTLALTLILTLTYPSLRCRDAGHISESDADNDMKHDDMDQDDTDLRFVPNPNYPNPNRSNPNNPYPNNPNP
jgi:hypothetical protein